MSTTDRGHRRARILAIAFAALTAALTFRECAHDTSSTAHSRTAEPRIEASLSRARHAPSASKNDAPRHSAIPATEARKPAPAPASDTHIPPLPSPQGSADIIEIGEPFDVNIPSEEPTSDYSVIIQLGSAIDADDPVATPAIPATETITIGEVISADEAPR